MSDTTTAAHLVSALRTHRVRSERNGAAVPELLATLERLAVCACQGQSGTTSASGVAFGDHEPVTARLLTYRQAADALACSERTVKRLVVAGDLDVVHIGHAARVRVTDLDRFVADLCVRPDISNPTESETQ